MKQYVYLYLKIGAGAGCVIFLGNMMSVLIPGNTRIDPNYEWSQLSLKKYGECAVISVTKAVIAGVTWPLLAVRIVQDLAIHPEQFGNFMHLGYGKSPHYAQL